MKRCQKIIIGVISPFIVLGATLGIFVASLTCFRSYEGLKENRLSNWMSYLKDDIEINEVIIPGSHDAGTYGMNWLGATQHLDMKSQLEIGTRYFDLRVNKLENDYVIFHSIINGTKFDPLFSTIVDFIKTNPSETLFLDFQHFKNGSEEYVFNEVKTKLDGYLVKNDTRNSDLEFISNLKIADTRGKCVVFFGGESIYQNENYIFSRNNDSGSKENKSLDSYYFGERHAKDSKTFIEESLPYYARKIEEKINKEKHKGMFVLQGQLTDANLVFGPYSKERSHEGNMKTYISNLHTETYFKHINIIMRDFLDETKTRDIIKLNTIKGTVK